MAETKKTEFLEDFFASFDTPLDPIGTKVVEIRITSKLQYLK